MRAFWHGVAAGAAALVTTGIARALLATPFVPELLALRLFEWVPMDLFSYFVGSFGLFSKWIALAGTFALTLIASGALALAVRAGRRGGFFSRWLLPTSLLALLGIFVFLPAVGSDPRGRGLYPAPKAPAALGIVIGAATYCAALAWLETPVSDRRRSGRAFPGASPRKG